MANRRKNRGPVFNKNRKHGHKNAFKRRRCHKIGYESEEQALEAKARAIEAGRGDETLEPYVCRICKANGTKRQIHLGHPQ